ncbi:MAG: LPS export ABC transporter periplasmic protein LptC [Candidatus Omnitrophota bacterium]|nr:LPS export ABC transporter periplasmic protein LptC [Candidatus Omnitrophota bacterium]
MMFRGKVLKCEIRVINLISCPWLWLSPRHWRGSEAKPLPCALWLFLIFCFGICNSSFSAQEAALEADQQISDFDISGHGEKGKKTWDLSAKTADIFQEQVKLMNVVGNLYGKEEDVKLIAESGNFDKESGKVHLEQDVVITTSGGTELTTDSLDWDRKGEVVTTNDIVNIKREDMIVKATGAKGEPNLKKVILERDVRLDIEPEITITCNGPLEINYEKNIAQFNNNVKVIYQNSEILSDKMDVYFISTGTDKTKDNSKKGTGLTGSKIDRIIARGNVRIIRGENVSYSEEAIYTASDKKVVLTGRPKLTICSTEGIKDAFTGN